MRPYLVEANHYFREKENEGINRLASIWKRTIAHYSHLTKKEHGLGVSTGSMSCLSLFDSDTIMYGYSSRLKGTSASRVLGHILLRCFRVDLDGCCAWARCVSVDWHEWERCLALSVINETSTSLHEEYEESSKFEKYGRSLQKMQLRKISQAVHAVFKSYCRWLRSTIILIT